MSTAILTGTLSTGETRAWSFAATLPDLLRRAWEHPLSPAERDLRRLAEFAVSQLGAGLLASQDLEDLDARVDDVLHGDQLAHLESLLLSLLPRLLPMRRTIPAGLRDAAEQVSLGALEAIEQGDKLESHMLAAWHRVVAHLPPGALEDTGETLRKTSAMSLFYNARMPAEVADAILGIQMATVSALGLVAALERATTARVEPWLVLGLAERRREGLWRYLRLLASMPGSEVPLDVVALRDRYDIGALEARHQRGMERANAIFLAPSAGLGSEWD